MLTLHHPLAICVLSSTRHEKGGRITFEASVSAKGISYGRWGRREAMILVERLRNRYVTLRTIRSIINLGDVECHDEDPAQLSYHGQSETLKILLEKLRKKSSDLVLPFAVSIQTRYQDNVPTNLKDRIDRLLGANSGADELYQARGITYGYRRGRHTTSTTGSPLARGIVFAKHDYLALPPSLLRDLKQLHVEDQRGFLRDYGRVSPVAIAKFGRNLDLGPLPLRHLHQGLIPSF